MRKIRANYFVLGFLFLGSCGHLPTGKSPSRVLHTWSELGANSSMMVRAIVDGENCPEVKVNGQLQAMTFRGKKSKAFAIRVCDRVLDSTATQIKIGEKELPKMVLNPKKIVVIGDTGCRIKETKKGKFYIQGCNVLNDWPLANVTKAAADFAPDLVIHVGDYNYREASCPDDHAECKGSPSGDQWPTWEADFFKPAQGLLDRAPWIFVRGNHELCNRAGSGWTLLFGSNADADRCHNKTPPYEVDLGSQHFAVVDSADDRNIQPSLELIAKTVSASKPLWILTHRPFLTPSADDEAHGVAELPEQLAKPGQVAGVFTGHIHVLSLNRFTDQRPPEIISGNSGSALDTHSLPYQGKSGIQVDAFRDFGFLTLEKKSSDEWQVISRDRSGKPVVDCEFKTALESKSVLTCQPRTN